MPYDSAAKAGLVASATLVLLPVLALRGGSFEAVGAPMVTAGLGAFVAIASLGWRPRGRA